MVDQQIRGRGITDERVLKALREVPRHLFVNDAFFDQAYQDSALPIGEQQTISQPYIVALMTEVLALEGDERVLEVGTGSGYQAAVLSKLCRKVYTIEKIASLAMRARSAFDQCEISNVVSKIGDGTCGWPEEAPFDAIIVTAAYKEIPECLVHQLKAPDAGKRGGRLVMPVGSEGFQELIRIELEEGGRRKETNFGGCRFVRLVGKYGHSG